MKLSTSQRRKERRKKAQQKLLNGNQLVPEVNSSQVDESDNVNRSSKKKKKSKVRNRGDPPTYLEAISTENYSHISDTDDRKEEFMYNTDIGNENVSSDEGPSVDDDDDEVESKTLNMYQGDVEDGEMNEDDVDYLKGDPPNYESIFNNVVKENHDDTDFINENITKPSLMPSYHEEDKVDGEWCVVSEKSKKKGKMKVRQMDQPLSIRNVLMHREMDEERELRLAIEESKRMYAIERGNIEKDGSKDPQGGPANVTPIIDVPTSRQDSFELPVNSCMGYDDQTDEDSVECHFINEDYENEIIEQNTKPSDRSSFCNIEANKKCTKKDTKSHHFTTPSKSISQIKEDATTSVKGGKTEGKMVAKEVKHNELESLLLQRWKTIDPLRGIDVLPLTSMGKRKADICVIGSC